MSRKKNILGTGTRLIYTPLRVYEILSHMPDTNKHQTSNSQLTSYTSTIKNQKRGSIAHRKRRYTPGMTRLRSKLVLGGSGSLAGFFARGLFFSISFRDFPSSFQLVRRPQVNKPQPHPGRIKLAWCHTWNVQTLF